MQFYDHVDCYVEREKLNEYDRDKKIKIILNGWFMHFGENWPPAKNMPCLALETPTIFVTGERLEGKNAIRAGGRFEDLIELFNVEKCKKNKLTIKGFSFIDKNTKITNSNEYKKYRTDLINKCHTFMKEGEIN